MDRAALETYITENYSAEADHPWARYPDYTVFRHGNNKKWFAVIMKIPRARLGCPGEDVLDVVNLKCDPLMLGSLLLESGFFLAYHMNKNNWITAALDGSAAEETIKILLDMSFDATAVKCRKRTAPDDKS